MSSTRRPGRRPTYDTAATAVVKIRMTDAQRLELRRVASGSKLGMAGVIREAVNCYVEDYGDRLPFRRRPR